MDAEKIFIDLESNQTHESEEAKKKLVEIFSQSKETWLVHNMMEYYLRSDSLRIVEVLVKVQSPHDNYIFDRLSEWLNKPHTHRVQALNLFLFVVRKHPTWLYKVQKHRLLKDILKLLQNEKEIVPFMSALLSIIILLPIIPSLVPTFLNELFDIFGRLALWNQNSELPDDKLVHLQLGLQILFQRLYGMYPWRFLNFLSDFIKKERGSIFQHTIEPLLKTVRVHPMLVVANFDTELSSSRWKKCEPHDVVIECVKLALPVMQPQDIMLEQTQQINTHELLDTPGGKRSSASLNAPYPYQLRELQQQCGPIVRFERGMTSSSSIWSPYNEITASGPIPLTPTPSFMLPMSSTAAVATAAPAAIVSLNNQLLGVTGSSPPEAAVEATPETTPMKDLKELKQSVNVSVANPHAVRAIFAASSQPSSPMRKDYNQFNFPEVVNADQPYFIRTMSQVTSTYDRRLQQMIHERKTSTNQSTSSPLQLIEPLKKALDAVAVAAEANSIATTIAPANIPPLVVAQDTTEPELALYAKSFTPIQPSTPTPMCTPVPTPTPIELIQKTCDDCNETDRSLCTAGGLQIPSHTSIQLMAKGLKRRRMASYCCNDNSYDKCNNVNGRTGDDAANSRDDANAVGNMIKVRRTKSCSSIYSASLSKAKDFFDIADADSDGSGDNLDETLKGSERRLQKSGKMFAIASASKRATTPVSQAHVGSQTDDILSHTYENWLLSVLLEFRELYRADESVPFQPQQKLEQYVLHATQTRDSVLDQEKYQLLCLQLQYERYRREIHAERNRRLMGRSREKRSLEMELERLREQLKNFEAVNRECSEQLQKTFKASNERDQLYKDDLMKLQIRYQNELELNKNLRKTNDELQTRLNDELTARKELNYELEALRGQIFNLTSELENAQIHVDLGLQYKQELARLEAEFIVMGEVQIKCRDKMAELESSKAREEEFQLLQDTYQMQVKDFKHSLEDKSTQLESAKHKIAELHAQLIGCEKTQTEQKRLLKTVKDEYEEKYKALNKKYDVQKMIIMQMEEKIAMTMHKSTAPKATCSPDTDKTDPGSSMERNSPLSTSLASSESLSSSLRSTELRSLQQVIEETPVSEAELSRGGGAINVIGSGPNIIEGTRLPTLDLACSANTVSILAAGPSSAKAFAAATATTTGAINAASSSSSASAAIEIMPSTSQHTHHLATTAAGTHAQQQQQQQQKQKR